MRGTHGGTGMEVAGAGQRRWSSACTSATNCA